MRLRGDALERRERARRHPCSQAGEEQHQRQRVAQCSPGIVGDQRAPRCGIVAAVDPQFAIPAAARRSAVRPELLQPRRPVGPAHRRARARRRARSSASWWRSMATASAAFIAWCRPGRRGSGRSSVAGAVAVAQLAWRHDRVPRAAARQPGRAGLHARSRRSGRRSPADKAG